jgi:hypothetical protein
MGRWLALAVVALFAVAAADYSEEYDDDYFQDDKQTYNTLSVCVDSSGKLYTKEGTECDQKVAVGKFKDAINQTGYYLSFSISYEK